MQWNEEDQLPHVDAQHEYFTVRKHTASIANGAFPWHHLPAFLKLWNFATATPPSFSTRPHQVAEPAWSVELLCLSQPPSTPPSVSHVNGQS